MMLPEEQVEAMLAAPRAGPPRAARAHPCASSSPASSSATSAEVEIEAPGLRLRARTHAA